SDTDAQSSTDRDDEDPNWSWTRKAIVDLVDKGFATEGPASIPIDLRGQVWAVLERLTEDPDPSPEYEARFGGSNMDPPTLALNTVRGAAMTAVMRYVAWVRQNSEKRGTTVSLAEMSEVLVVLEKHLDPTRDPSLAVRSVYGRWLPWLVSWDRSWVQSHLALILPRDERLAILWEAAWDTYVVFCPPYNETFKVLSEEYRHAIERIGR